MNLSSEKLTLLNNAKEVFLLFLIPIGGGIPAGVVLGNSRGLTWEVMTFLYFCSDLVLACCFDPVMKLFIHFGRRSNFVARINEAFRKSMQMATSQFGLNPKPWLLILISFGVDPMTGRSLAYMSGHGFFAGWAIAITGDMIFYLVVMASTLWLNQLLGNGTWTAIIITAAIIIIPHILKKIRSRYFVKI